MASMQVNLPLDGEQATSSLSRLPPELLLEIFSYLPPPDVKKCRLVSTALRVAGEPFLLPVMNLTFESSCFDRLEEICKIPSVCFGVHQIQYNINCLVRNSQSIDNLTAYHENRERRPPSTSTAQDQISTDWNPTVSQFHETLVDIVRRPMHYSDLDFRRTRTAYEAICRDQERMHQAGDNSAIITQAFKMLPNLTAVTVDVQPCYNVSFESNQLIQNTAGVYFSNNIDQMQLGYDVSQLRSLLNGTMEVGRPLKYLKCNLMSWRIFSQAKQDFENTTAALQQLKHLELTIDVECLGIYPDDHRPNVLPYLITLPRDEAVYARRYLLNGRVSDFLAAAPNLECLHFQWQRAVIELDLWMVVGTHTWSFLKTLHLWHIHTQSVVLRSLLSRHATTLRDVKLAFWSITDGLWAPMFLFMRQVLSLEAFKAYRLQGLEESDLWIPCGEHVARTDGRIRFNPLNDHLMDIITRYVTGNGHAPLLHREQKEFGEIEEESPKKDSIEEDLLKEKSIDGNNIQQDGTWENRFRQDRSQEDCMGDDTTGKNSTVQHRLYIKQWGQRQEKPIVYDPYKTITREDVQHSNPSIPSSSVCLAAEVLDSHVSGPSSHGIPLRLMTGPRTSYFAYREQWSQ